MKIKSNVKKSIAKFLVLVACATSSYAVRANIYTDNKIPKNIENRIEKIVNAPSHLAGIDNFERKPKIERIKDNIKWYKKYKIVNLDYNKYCLDIKDYRNQDDYLTGKELNRLGIHHGNINPEKYKKLLEDKILFDEKVRKYYPKSLVDVYFEFKGKNIIPRKNTLLTCYKDTLSALKSLHDGKYFIKELDGLCGNNAILLTKQKGNMHFKHVTKGEITLKDFWKITNKRNFLVQKHIENHETIKKLSPVALSTVRMVTTRFNNNVNILSCDLRVGCNKDSIVDNFAKEGAIIHVDEKTGKLSKYGFRKHKKTIDKHPISGIKFQNYQLPFWKESVKLVKNLNKLFPEFSSVGWDIAITKNGPLVIEGNHNWDYTIPQTTIGGLKEKWEKAKNI